MDEQQIEEIADRVVDALNGLAPGDPTGWEIAAAFGPAAVFVGGIITLVIGLMSLNRQRINAEKQSADQKEAMAERRRADDRAEWWKRAQWALDASLSESAVRQDLGFKMLERLVTAGSVDREDLELLEPAWRRSAAANGSQAVAVMEESTVALPDLAGQGYIPQDYVDEFRRVLDDEGSGEHNGTDTGKGKDSDERNSEA